MQAVAGYGDGRSQGGEYVPVYDVTACDRCRCSAIDAGSLCRSETFDEIPVHRRQSNAREIDALGARLWQEDIVPMDAYIHKLRREVDCRRGNVELRRREIQLDLS